MTHWSALGEVTPESLAALVWNHPKILIMSDYDGTIVPIKNKPELAIPGREVLNLLARISQHPCLTIAIISGRDRRDLKKLIPLKEICLIGGHGIEIPPPWSDGKWEYSISDIQQTLDTIAEIVRTKVHAFNGFLVERKRTSIALHYRLANPSHVKRVLEGFIDAAKPYLDGKLEFLQGKKVLELRSRLAGKGKAVQHLITMREGYFPLYFGDDITDEEAFAVVRNSGLGILVSEVPKEGSAANGHLKNTQEVLKFLKILSTRCSC